MRPKLDSLSSPLSPPPKGEGAFPSPVSETSHSSCKKVHISASFSGSTNTILSPAATPHSFHGRFSLDHGGHNPVTVSMILSLSDVQVQYRPPDTVTAVNNESIPPPPALIPQSEPTTAPQLASNDEVSRSESQDEVNVIDATTGQPKRLSDAEHDDTTTSIS